MTEKQISVMSMSIIITSIIVAILVFIGTLHTNFLGLAACCLFLINAVRYYTLQNKGFSGILMITICVLLLIGQVAIMVR